jgi:hypothetical protein
MLGAMTRSMDGFRVARQAAVRGLVLCVCTALTAGACKSDQSDDAHLVTPASAHGESTQAAPTDDELPSGRAEPSAPQHESDKPAEPTTTKPTEPTTTKPTSTPSGAQPAPSKPLVPAAETKPAVTKAPAAETKTAAATTPAVNPTPANPAPAKPAEPEKPKAAPVNVPQTKHVKVEVPKRMQQLLDADPRMQPWLDRTFATIEACYAEERKQNPLAEGTIAVKLTMHENARPDADVTQLPPQLSGVLGCATGKLMRAQRMPLFTGKEGEKHTVRVSFSR